MHGFLFPGREADCRFPTKITAISLTIRHHIASQTEIKAVKFINSLLVPPPKRLVLGYLGIPTAVGERAEKKDVEIIRKAESDVCYSTFYSTLTHAVVHIACQLVPGCRQWVCLYDP
jgi:hypothetical protein